MTSSIPLVDTIFANQVSWLRNINTAGIPQPARITIDLPARIVFAATRMVTAAWGDEELSETISTLRLLDQSSILAWSARPDRATNLRLHARGFRESFAPTWMWHDLAEIPPVPGHDIVIAAATPDDRVAYLAASGVPYINRETSGAVLDRILDDCPRSVMLLAWADGVVVGTGAMHVTESSAASVGGIYNLAVAPNWRRRGIATAITLRLLRLAREQGAKGACLNATPEGQLVYERIGFQVAGHGQTWFMPDGADLPPSAVIAAGEALGRGEMSELDPAIARRETMPNGEPPVRFAARFGQDSGIRWLLDRGANPDIHPPWSRGFRQEAMQAMVDPGLRDRLWGTPGATALHEAVRTDDEPLLHAQLHAGADRTVRDGEWNATPLEWARVLGRDRLARLLDAEGSASV